MAHIKREEIKAGKPIEAKEFLKYGHRNSGEPRYTTKYRTTEKTTSSQSQNY